MTRTERKRKRKIQVNQLSSNYLGEFADYLEKNVMGNDADGTTMFIRCLADIMDRIKLHIKQHPTEAEVYREAGHYFIESAIDTLNESVPDFLIDAENLKIKLGYYIQ